MAQLGKGMPHGIEMQACRARKRLPAEFKNYMVGETKYPESLSVEGGTNPRGSCLGTTYCQQR